MSIIKEVILKPKFDTSEISTTASQAQNALQPINELGQEIEQTFKDAFSPKSVLELSKQLAILRREGKANTDEFKNIQKQIQEIDKANGVGNFTKKVITLKGELRQLKEQLSTVDESSPQFEELSIRAAQLQDQIGDVNERVRVLASDTFKFDAAVGAVRGLTAAFSVAQGASALFGKENEDVQKALLKVQAATAILTGTQELANIVTGQGAFKLAVLTAAQKVQTFVTNGATVATRAFNAALVATGIGAAIAAVTSLVVYWEDISKFIGLSTDKVKEFELANVQLKGTLEQQLEVLKAQGAEQDVIAAKEKEINTERIKSLQGQINALEKVTDLGNSLVVINGKTYNNEQLQKYIQSLRQELEILNAKNIGLDKSVKLRKEEADRVDELRLLIKKLSASFSETLIGYDVERKLETVIKRAAELYIDNFKRGNKTIGDDLVANLTKKDVPPLKIPIEVKNAIQLRDFINNELRPAAKGFVDDFFAIGANVREQRINNEIADLNAIKDARLQNEELTEAEKLVIQKQYDADIAKLKQEQFKREQQAAIAQAIINGALSITNLASRFPPPSPAFFAGLALLKFQTASQIALIKSTPPPAFKDGVIDFKGKGTATSDSNLVRISRGESVMTAAETQEHGDALMAIRKGQFEQFINQRAFETERLNAVRAKKDERRSNIRKKGKEKITIDNYDQIGASVASRLNYAGYTKRR